MLRENFSAWAANPERRALVMGVLNVTPDSFSDGGSFVDPSRALDHALAMADAGAGWIDVGAESTRPGSRGVSAGEQIRRLDPVLRRLRQKLPLTISVDTFDPDVAGAAIDLGADVVNDITAAADPRMLPLVARHGVGVILMHMQGTPATMQQNPSYADVTAEVRSYLLRRCEAALSAGVARDRILIDPGIGFGKNLSHNLRLLKDTHKLAELPFPLVIGTSRKKFIGDVTAQPLPQQRLFGTAATVAWSVANGAAVVRVHDVAPMVEVVKMIQALRSGVPPGPASGNFGP